MTKTPFGYSDGPPTHLCLRQLRGELARSRLNEWWPVITTIVAIAAFAAGYGTRALYSRYRRRRWRRAQDAQEQTAQQVLTAAKASPSASG
jgi:hypothetical protein